MNTQNLINLAKTVAAIRQDVETTKGNRDQAEVLMLESANGIAFRLCGDDFKRNQEFLSEAESKLKSAVLEVYEETKEKKPIDKVEVKIFKRLESDPAEVLAWCRENAPSLLIVNKKPFEKTAVDIGAPVKVIEEAKCTIASDLSCYLKKEE